VRRLMFILISAVAAASTAGCARKTYDPVWATRPYPDNLHTTKGVADMQVFRDDTDIQIVNTTATSYQHVDLWVNQRYVAHVESLPAGQTVTLSLWDFKDEYGNLFYAGGFFRTYPATPVRLVEIQTAPEQPLIGLVTIRREDITVPAEPGR
jgi:hypothetical protein